MEFTWMMNDGRAAAVRYSCEYRLRASEGYDKSTPPCSSKIAILPAPHLHPISELNSTLPGKRQSSEDWVKQRHCRDLNPVLETRSANHQHLLLFFLKLEKGQKAKPEKTKVFVFSGKEKPCTLLKNTALESASAKMLAWPRLFMFTWKSLSREFLQSHPAALSTTTDLSHLAEKSLTHPALQFLNMLSSSLLA